MFNSEACEIKTRLFEDRLEFGLGEKKSKQPFLFNNI